MAEHKHQHASCESCETIKNEEREKLKEDLKKCAAAREASEAEKQKELENSVTEAKEKIEKMKKQLLAFQLATVVGVTILGQETFDKIFAKVDEVKNVQSKITGINSGAESEEKSSGKTEKPKTGTKSVGFGGFSSKNHFDMTELSRFDNRIVITDEKFDQNKPWTPSETTIASATTTSGARILVDPPTTPPPSGTFVTNYDFPVVVMDIPTVVASLQYNLLPFQDSPFAFGQGETNITPVPTPNSFSLFALSLINQPRRRMI